MERPEPKLFKEGSVETIFENAKPTVITIDGRVGAGKGTTARILAERYGYRHLEAGALWRGAAVAAIDAELPVTDGDRLVEFIDGLDIVTVDEYQRSRTVVNGVDVTDRIGLPGVGELSTEISLNEKASSSLIDKVKEFAREGNAVIDGRGLGTEEVPGAPLKLFLTASLKERARRRHQQFVELGIAEPPALQEVVAEVHRRDVAEQNREYSPLRPAADAVIIDTGRHTADEVVNVAIHVHNQRKRAERGVDCEMYVDPKIA